MGAQLTDKRFCVVTGLAVTAALNRVLQVCGPQLVLCCGVLFGPALTSPCPSILPVPSPSAPGLSVADCLQGPWWFSWVPQAKKDDRIWGYFR